MTSLVGRPPAPATMASRSSPPPPYLTRVKLTNYRSIASCDVRLSALTFLVGPNGAGKSNFLDQVGPKETLEFRQTIGGAKNPWRFPAANMSDGTLRALGILVALFQPGGSGRIPLVGIEEPAVALHPAAAGVLMHYVRPPSIARS